MCPTTATTKASNHRHHHQTDNNDNNDNCSTLSLLLMLPPELWYLIIDYSSDIGATMRHLSMLHPLLTNELQDQCSYVTKNDIIHISPNNNDIDNIDKNKNNKNNQFPTWFLTCVVQPCRFDMKLVRYSMDMARAMMFTANTTNSSDPSRYSVYRIGTRKRMKMTVQANHGAVHGSLLYWKLICCLLPKVSYLTVYDHAMLPTNNSPSLLFNTVGGDSNVVDVGVDVVDDPVLLLSRKRGAREELQKHQYMQIDWIFDHRHMVTEYELDDGRTIKMKFELVQQYYHQNHQNHQNQNHPNGTNYQSYRRHRTSNVIVEKVVSIDEPCRIRGLLKVNYDDGHVMLRNTVLVSQISPIIHCDHGTYQSSRMRDLEDYKPRTRWSCAQQQQPCCSESTNFAHYDNGSNDSGSDIDFDFTLMNTNEFKELVTLYPQMEAMMSNSPQIQVRAVDMQRFIQDMYGRRYRIRGKLFRVYYRHRMLLEVSPMRQQEQRSFSFKNRNSNDNNYSLIVHTGKHSNFAFAVPGDEVEIEGTFDNVRHFRAERIHLVKPSYRPVLSSEDIRILMLIVAVHVVSTSLSIFSFPPLLLQQQRQQEQQDEHPLNWYAIGVTVLTSVIHSCLHSVLTVIPVGVMSVFLSHVSPRRIMGLLFIPGSLGIGEIWHSLHLSSILKFLLYLWQMGVLCLVVFRLVDNVRFNKQKTRSDPVWLDKTRAMSWSNHRKKSIPTSSHEGAASAC